MLNERRSYSHTFVCVAATLLLIFGYSNYVFAEETGDSEARIVSYSTQSSNANQKAGAAPDDSSAEPPPVLSIFFVNDLQYDIFPVHPENGSMCDTDAVSEGEKCVGGLPSLKMLMDDHANLTNSIWLNAGNTLGGDLFRILKFRTAIEAMHLLDFSAMAVGPSVFKFGGNAGRKFLDGLKQSIVVSNINPAPQFKSLIFPVENCNVAVIGYLENTELDQGLRGVSIRDYTRSVLEEATRLQKEYSNLITVVIGSSSVKQSKILARNEAIDFVFFSGANWSAEAEKNKMQNPPQLYWEPVNHKPKRTAYVGSLRVNQSDMASRFIVGLIELPITSDCSVGSASSKFLKYNTPTTSNNTALDLIKVELDLLQNMNKPLTQNSKNLAAERDLCHNSECSLGNLITDAMVAAMNGDSNWSGNYARIGIFPAILLQPKATIPKGSVTAMNIYGLFDEDAYIYSVLLMGWQLKELFEVSIKSSSNPNSVDFLHVSRLLQIQYRKDNRNEPQIVSVKTVPAMSSSMQLSEIAVNDGATFYNVSIPLTLLKMDSYKNVLSAVNASFHPVTIVDAVTKYINKTRALSLPVLGSRFVLLEPNPAPPHSVSMGIIFAGTLIIALLTICLILAMWKYVFGHWPQSDKESATERSSGNTDLQTSNAVSQHQHVSSWKSSQSIRNMILKPSKFFFVISEHGTKPKS